MLPNYARPIPFTLEYLNECFSYDPKSGDIVWKVRPLHHFTNKNSQGATNTQFAGLVAGHAKESRADKYYLQVGIGGSLYFAHRIIWYMMTGEDATFPIDHINGDGLDNRWENLRRGDEINLRNKSLHRNNTSGYNGIAWRNDNQKWRVRLAITQPDGTTRRITVGQFEPDELHLAIKARDEAYIKYGYDPNHGKSREDRLID